MHRGPPGCKELVRRCLEERVRELDRVSFEACDLGFGGRPERGARVTVQGRVEEIDRRAREGRGVPQRVQRRLAEGAEPLVDELVQAPGNRQRVARGERRRRERSRELQCVERIAAARVVQTPQRRSRERCVETIVEHASEGADGEWLEVERLHLALAERGGELARHRLVRAASQESVHGHAIQAPEGVSEGCSRRRIDPLDIVDCEHERRAVGDGEQSRPERDGDRGLLRRCVARILAEKRDGERAALRRRQLVLDLREAVREQVAHCGERDLCLGGDCGRREDASTFGSRTLDRCAPEGRLSHAGHAVDHEGRGSRRVEPTVDRSELGVAADDLVHRRSVTTSATRGKVSLRRAPGAGGGRTASAGSP